MNTQYFDSRDSQSQWEMNKCLFELVKSSKKSYNHLAILCIGTDKSTGDSYGPLAGQMLSRLESYEFDLYGTLEKPVHALSLADTLKWIDTDHSLVIAVDACLGRAEHVGSIGIGLEPLKPGSSMGKDLPIVGDVSITGIVALSGISPFLMLQSAPLGLVYEMAERTAQAIQSMLYRIQYKSHAQLSLTRYFDRAVSS